MTQVCTESGFPELAIGMTRSATTGHPSLFWSKHFQEASGTQQPREPGSLGSQGLWYSLFTSQDQEKVHLFSLSLFPLSSTSFHLPYIQRNSVIIQGRFV